MASSDDEVEAAVEFITNYYFVDDNGEPTSFIVLPIIWHETRISTSTKPYVFLHGTTASGSETIYKKVVAWKLDFSYDQPEISVLSKENKWIKLRKPRKSFEDTIRTVLITIHCLNFFKKYPERSESSLWRHLHEVFSLCKVKPSENDLLGHLPLIKAAAEQDKTIAKSVFRLAILKDPMKRKMFDEVMYDDIAVKKSKLTTENDKGLDGETEPTTGSDSDQICDLCDDVCALCDNGGDVICCEGRCLRSFHATVDTGFASGCKSLCLSKEHVEAPHFFCMNCQYNQHQCFACGKLGSSDRSNNPEVFRCAFPACGHFYHPLCIGKLLHPINGHAADQIQKKIIAGEPFTCTVHKCSICKQEEDKRRNEKQFAVCRRCPKAYHRECMPRRIAFETSMDEDLIKRAWDGLLPDRLLIYCLKHEVNIRTLLPEGNHIIFPDVQEKKKIHPPTMKPRQGNIDIERTNVDSRNYPKEVLANQQKKMVQFSHSNKDHNSTNLHAKPASRERFLSKKKSQGVSASSLHQKNRVKNISVKGDKFSALGEANTILKGDLKQMQTKGLDSAKSKQDIVSCKLSNEKRHVTVTKKSSSSPSSVRTEMQMRVVELKKQKSPQKRQELVTEMHKERSSQVTSINIGNIAIPPPNVNESITDVSALTQELEHSFDPKASYEAKASNHNKASPKLFSSNNIVDNIVHRGNGGGRVKVMSKSLQDDEASIKKLEQGLDDPKANYAPGNFKYQAKLEIADMLISYAQNGDTILNFCYHDNDFSCLVRQRLEETGKRCPVKNYDIFHLEGDFDFEEDCIPTGSRLIMGLLFPPGVGVAVNKLIDKVLKFIPKFLLLLCPKETKRLDENESRYELILEEYEHFSSKFLYGSMCLKTPELPRLYLWSRCDWSTKNKSISNELRNPKREDKTNCITDITNQIGDLPRGNDELEESEEVREVICEELIDTSADFESGMVDTSRSKAVSNDKSLQFVHGPALMFLHESCGWLDE